MKIFQRYDFDTADMSELVKKIIGNTDKNFRHSVKVDRVAFFVKEGMLKHAYIKAVSQLELKQDFFADFEIPVQIIKEGVYNFRLNTNQPTSLYLDGKELISVAESKDLKEENITVPLAKGRHNFKLIYFQESQSEAKGVTLSYSQEDSNKYYVVGQSSRYIKF